jgi:hypothetical protein
MIKYMFIRDLHERASLHFSDPAPIPNVSSFRQTSKRSDGRGSDEDFSSPPRTDPGVRC